MSTLTEPLRQLLQKQTAWHWGHEQKQCMTTLKNTLPSEPLLKYIDSKIPVVLTVDASQKGHGAAILQEGRPVAFASRSLSETEKSYAQIEKETLAVVFGCEKFQHYLYGRKFTVESDHKPLEFIFKKPLNKAPPRIQRFMLRLQKYDDFQVVHVPGTKMNVSDTLSRVSLPQTNNDIILE